VPGAVARWVTPDTAPALGNNGRMNGVHSWLLAAALGLGLLACGGGDSSGTSQTSPVNQGGAGQGGAGQGGAGIAGQGGGGQGGNACVPGISVACVGPGACKGGQICKPDGSGFGPCDCGAGGGAGSAGNGGAPPAGQGGSLPAGQGGSLPAGQGGGGAGGVIEDTYCGVPESQLPSISACGDAGASDCAKAMCAATGAAAPKDCKKVLTDCHDDAGCNKSVSCGAVCRENDPSADVVATCTPLAGAAIGKALAYKGCADHLTACGGDGTYDTAAPDPSSAAKMADALQEGQACEACIAGLKGTVKDGSGGDVLCDSAVAKCDNDKTCQDFITFTKEAATSTGKADRNCWIDAASSALNGGNLSSYELITCMTVLCGTVCGDLSLSPPVGCE